MLTPAPDRPGSLLSRQDPRLRLIAAALYAVCCSLAQSLIASWLYLAFSFALLAVSGPHLSAVGRRLFSVNLFIAFLWLTVPLTVPPAVPGGELLKLGPLAVSGEGVRLALQVTLKCNAILLAFLAFTAGLDLPRIGACLERLRVPPKLVFLFLFTCRYIYVIGEEWHKLQTAAKLRGFVPRTSLHTYATIGNMLGLVFVNSIDRSRRIYEAMLTRGFTGSFRTVADAGAASGGVLFAAAALPPPVVLAIADFWLR